MEYIIGAVWSILELISFSVFCSAFLVKTADAKKCRLFYSAAFCVMYLFTNIINIAPAQQIINIAAYVCLSFCLYRGQWLKHLLTVALLFVFASAIDTLMLYSTSLVLEIGYDEYSFNRGYRSRFQ